MTFNTIGQAMKGKMVLSFFIVLFLSHSIGSYGANQGSNPAFSQLITSHFTKQWRNFPQEKLYLQTDKPYYSAGEKIWFKGYLMYATTLEPSALSQFVYVELIDTRDSMLSMVKIRKDSLGFAGHINLKPNTPTGYYTLRAYTYWMRNAGTEFFYSKHILIGNVMDDRVSSKLTYGTPVGGMISVSITFTDAAHNPISGKKVEIIQRWRNARKKELSLLTDKDGNVNWQMKVDSTDNAKKHIDVSMPDEKYHTTFFLPEFDTDFDVQFFPESGVLLNNSLQSVAFKAIGKNGLSVAVTGKVFTNKNKEITNLSTLHKGMGKFSFQTQPNETYYALLKTAEGKQKRFELPTSQDVGAIVQLAHNKGNILYRLVNQTKLADASLYLLIHSSGKVYAVQSLNDVEGQISESSLPPGIVSFSVIDSVGNTYCERLSFVRNFNFPTVTMQADKPVYGKRELINLNLHVRSTLGKDVKGSYSVSITDGYLVKQDTLADNIASNLLLTSDLKGYVEDPASYFTDNTIATREKTDVLMMTQGWRRFNALYIVKGIYATPRYYLEMGQALSGKVLNLFNAPSKKCDIIMISPYKNLIKRVKTDSLGCYLIDGIEFPDSTSFVLKAKKAKSITDVEIVPDKDDFPNIKTYIPLPLKTNIATAEQEAYFTQSKEKYYYEGGMRIINLGEVTVKAEKKTDTDKSYYAGLADAEITTEQLDKHSNTSVTDLLYTVSGIRMFGDRISIRGAADNPTFFVDNVEIHDMEEISYLTSNDIQRIQVIKGANASIFGSRGGNGVVVIKLKEGAQLKTKTPISLAHVMPLGYQKPAEFYVPKYEVDSVYQSSRPDLRTTIYWNPHLAADSTGNVLVKFYAADKDNNYSVVFEGVTATGEICRYEGILRRKME